MSTRKTYAVLIDGRVRGTLTAAVQSGMVSAAGSITRDGAPVNRAGAHLSLNVHHLRHAVERDMPTYVLRTYRGHDFIVPDSEIRNG